MTHLAPAIILGSGSPRRVDLLGLLAVQFDVVVPGVQEPEGATVDELARAKFDHLVGRHPGRTILTADTLVLLGATQLGKPRDGAHARAMLTRCAGQAITVASAVCVGNNDSVATARVETTVQLRELTGAEIDRYLASGVGSDKAGALALQDQASGFVDRTSAYATAGCNHGGCYSNVVGLPLCATADLLGIARRPELCVWPAG